VFEEGGTQDCWMFTEWSGKSDGGDDEGIVVLWKLIETLLKT
jgi:hypothetical protein